MAALIHNLGQQQQLAAVELAARVALLAAVVGSGKFIENRFLENRFLENFGGRIVRKWITKW
jgi:hypothetical protein